MAENEKIRRIDREDAVDLLRKKQEELQQAGEQRYPKRSDFSDQEVVAIKAFLGPWPRALEAAALKPPRNDDRMQRNREKRIRAKRARLAARKREQEIKKAAKETS